MTHVTEIERLTKLLADKETELGMSKKSVKSYKRAVEGGGGNNKKTKKAVSNGATQQVKRLTKEGNCIACLFRRGIIINVL